MVDYFGSTFNETAAELKDGSRRTLTLQNEFERIIGVNAYAVKVNGCIINPPASRIV